LCPVTAQIQSLAQKFSTFSTKNGVRYLFYVSSALLKGRKENAGSLPRVSAVEIEKAILTALGPRLEEQANNSSTMAMCTIEGLVSRVELSAKQAVIKVNPMSDTPSRPHRGSIENRRHDEPGLGSAPKARQH
jgi:hypothetical protein